MSLAWAARAQALTLTTGKKESDERGEENSPTDG